MTQNIDNLERVRKLVEAVCPGNVPDSLNLHDLKRDLDRFAESLRSDDIAKRHYLTREKTRKANTMRWRVIRREYSLPLNRSRFAIEISQMISASLIRISS